MSDFRLLVQFGTFQVKMVSSGFASPPPCPIRVKERFKFFMSNSDIPKQIIIMGPYGLGPGLYEGEAGRE